jgi:hypothetical protein
MRYAERPRGEKEVHWVARDRHAPPKTSSWEGWEAFFQPLRVRGYERQTGKRIKKSLCGVCMCKGLRKSLPKLPRASKPLPSIVSGLLPFAF